MGRMRHYPESPERPAIRPLPEIVRAPAHGPNGAVADSLEEAGAAFQAAWERPIDRRVAMVVQVSPF